MAKKLKCAHDRCERDYLDLAVDRVTCLDCNKSWDEYSFGVLPKTKNDSIACSHTSRRTHFADHSVDFEVCLDCGKKREKYWFGKSESPISENKPEFADRRLIEWLKK